VNFRRGPDRINIFGDNLSKASPHNNWSSRVDNRSLSKILGINFVKMIRAVYNQNRVSGIIYIDGKSKKGSISISGFISRSGRELGWNVIKSNNFKIYNRSNDFIFKGRGLGHGVGLSQWGAKELACRGYKYRQILNFYYNKPEITKLK
jgi:SpoIID/LytB domain protein